MKKVSYSLFICLLFVACTKENGFYDEPLMTRLELAYNLVNPTNLDLMIGGELVEDSITRDWGNGVKAGLQRVQIRETGKNDFFIDTMMELANPAARLNLVQFGVTEKPFIFNGFGNVAPPAEGNIKFRMLNTDRTFTLNKQVDILVLDAEGINTLYEIKDLPYGRLTDYIEAPRYLFEQGCRFEIVESGNPANVLVSRDVYGFIYPSLYNAEHNIFVFKLYNAGGENWTYYEYYVIASEKK